MIVRCICGKNLRVPDQHQGKKMRCPSCGETFVAREASSAITSSAAAPIPNRPKTGAPAPDRGKGKSAKKSPKPISRELRPSSVLLVASGGLGAVALLGFIVSGVLFVLGLNASPVSRPPLIPPQAKADQKVVEGPTAKKEPVLAPPPGPATPAAPQPSPASQPKKPIRERRPRPNSAAPMPEKSKDEICCINGIMANSISVRNDDRRALLAAGGDLVLADLEKGSIVRRFPANGRGFIQSLFLPDGKQALATHADGRIEVLDLETGKVVHPLAVKTRVHLPLALSGGGRRVIGAGDHEDRFLYQWDIATGRETARTDELPSGVQKFSASADGQRVLLDSSGLPFIWDVEKGTKVRRLSPPIGPSTTHFALSPDGRRALFASRKLFLLWDVDRDEEMARFEPEQQPVYVAFAPDGRMALVASQGKTFWLYDLDRRILVRGFDGPGSASHYLVFSHDGRRAIFYTSLDRTLRVWQLPAREDSAQK